MYFFFFVEKINLKYSYMLLNSVHITLFNETQRRLTTVSNVMVVGTGRLNIVATLLSTDMYSTVKIIACGIINCRALFEELIMR